MNQIDLKMMMVKDKKVKNIFVSAIIGIILGAITEYALIINCKWLIEITQSFKVWGIIICVLAAFPKDYKFSIINPATTMTSMNITYYMIRLVKSGYTNVPNLELYTLTGIAVSMYIGTVIYFIKDLIFLHRKYKIHRYNLFFMTVLGLVFTLLGWQHSIRHNLFYNTDIGIIIGFVIAEAVTRSKL